MPRVVSLAVWATLPGLLVVGQTFPERKAPAVFGTVGVDTLGSTEVSNGHVLPFGKVECDQVRKALFFLTPGADFRERQRALGMALGPVVAHELYHILARTTSHATGRLPKASQSLRDLIRPDDLQISAQGSRGDP